MLYGEKKRVHLREKYTNTLALRFAIGTADVLKNSETEKNGPMGSFCIWRNDHKLNDLDLDPNYLIAENIHESPFHQVLHKFIDMNQGLPLMHVDIHGKMDRKDSYELDLGVACLYKHWANSSTIDECDFLTGFVECLTKGFNQCLKNIPKWKEYKAVCNNDPYLNGNWGGELRTMTEQAIMMGIPSIQLEIPLKMRAQLFKDSQLSKDFLSVIIMAYQQIVVNWWPARLPPLLWDARLGASVNTLPKNTTKRADLEKIHKDYVEWEKKQGLTEKVI